MALRVLLADNSETIKKVIQLSLQDFAVDVRSVQTGADVSNMAQNFQPDIIFVDVLLQKKNGYDVVTELRDIEAFKETPIILMWSGFMDLDEEKASSCGANDRLEKPFDSEMIRKLVTKWVPKLQNDQDMTAFLDFPEVPIQNDEEEEEEFSQVPAGQAISEMEKPPQPPSLPKDVPPFLDSNEEQQESPINESNVDDIQENEALEKTKILEDGGSTDLEPTPLPIDDEFQIDIPDNDFEGVNVDYNEPEEEIKDTSFLESSALPTEEPQKSSPEKSQNPESQESNPTTETLQPPLNQEPNEASPQQIAKEALNQLTPEEIKELIKEQSSDIIRTLARDVVADLAKEIIKDEINRILSEPEATP